MTRAGPAGGRDRALDAFRGVAVAGMALVNLQDPFRPAFPALEHAEWNGLTPADLVFPFFVLGVGLSAPLATDGPSPPGPARLLRRAAGLAGWGLALNLLLHPSWRPADLRVSGVLQRIAVVALACGLALRVRPGWRTPAAGAAALLAAHALLLHAPTPDGPASLARGEGLSGWLDRALLPGRLRGGYDPEGVLSTLSAVAEGLIGAAAMRWARAHPTDRAGLAAAGAALAAAGGLAGLALPVNKQLWTPPFALLTGGLGLLAFAGLRATAAPKAREARLAPAAFLGRNALTFYVVHTLLIALLLLRVDGERGWDRATDAAGALVPGPRTANLLSATVMALGCAGLTWALERRGWRLRA